ncbi:hypothetical protein BDN72DRAFT_780779 [Pluteus cervinus]|uniref:Uncharacterized protein n=1 Tax=Pluteus cervinus TaxID=181527 RepID=A0ACD3A142_9AGAR|nr:hypothetical protein BDN72DRAFT_780779 [Pluteus cervinus]
MGTLQEAIFSTRFSAQIGELCTCSKAPALHRCRDCFLAPALCLTCLVNAHLHSPFHRVQTWTGKFFVNDNLATLGLVVNLGHGGLRCPKSSEGDVRQMVIVHTNGMHLLRFSFCICLYAQSDFVQLVESQLFPATVDRPDTALTFNFLENLHIHTLCSKTSIHNHHKALTHLTDPIDPQRSPDRYAECCRVLRLWQLLASNRRSGQAHRIDTLLPHRSPGSVAVRCFACPEVGFNLENFIRYYPPCSFLTHLVSHKYTLYLSMDGNFRLQRLNKRQDPDDVALNNGTGCFVKYDEYREYLKGVSPSEEDSTCAHLQAVKMQNSIKFKNAVVSGVISVQCARHGIYMPKGTADLEKGEAYARSDYVLMRVLDEAQNQRWIMVSYDIWCQYWKNLHHRVAAHFPDKLPLLGHIRGAIPKMHIKGHIERCQLEWSFNYLKYSGETCGEKIEAGWAEQNQAAASTKQQNAGHRHDSLDDCFNFWNWHKLQTLVSYIEKKYLDCKKRLAERQKRFNHMCKDFSEKTLDEWKRLDTVPRKVGKMWTSPYVAHSSKGRPPSQLKAYQELVQKEQTAELASQGTVGDAEFVSKGLKIEAEQHRIQSLTSSKEPLLSDILSSRVSLQRLLKPWLLSQDKRTPDLRKHDPPLDLTQPETIPLYLPSFWNTKEHPSGFNTLVLIEFALREGQCHDALNKLRLAIKTFNANLKFKKDNVHGQHPNTRAQLFLATLNQDKVSALEKYNRSRDALLRLGLPPNDKTLQPLDKTQLWGRDMGLPAELGDTHKDEPWFWAVGRPNGLTKEEADDWNMQGNLYISTCGSYANTLLCS